MMPAKKIIMGAENNDDFYGYAGIPELDVGNIAVRTFAKTFTTENPSAKYLLLQSRCAPFMKRPNAHLTAEVLA
jgi:hypothetical protein